MNNRELKTFTHGSTETLSIGCVGCPDHKDCGGLYSSGAVISCLDWCKCINPTGCDKVCPRNQLEYVQRFQEVGGFSLDNIGRVTPIEAIPLPGFIPMIYHGSLRNKRLVSQAVVVPWQTLFSQKRQMVKFESKEEIFDKYKISVDSKLIISAVDIDPKIEPFWAFRHKVRLFDQLLKIKPDLFTCPNYSLLFGVPRQDNLYNMKRVVLGWSELVDAGINTALHLNARTDHDWQRLINFVSEREEVTAVSFEFGTGAKRVSRGRWHVENLISLANSTNRKLQLIVRGGTQYLSALRLAFHSVVSIDTTSFMKTVKRKKLLWYPTVKPKWVIQPRNVPLGDLLQENVEIYQRMMTFQTVPNSRFRTVGRASDAIALGK